MNLTQRIDERREYGEAICAAIAEAIRKLGIEPGSAGLPIFEQARFNLVTDPYSRHEDLVGHWFDERNQRVGQIQFHGDGGFYAEYDVLQAHPNKPKVFINTMNAWGKAGQIKIEAQQLDMPG